MTPNKTGKLNIKFSNDYMKLPDEMPFTAKLLQVLKCNYDDLSDSFIHYDTRNILEKRVYILPKTDLIVLILMSKEGKMFTTIRRYTPKKCGYYKANEGEEFEIVRS